MALIKGLAAFVAVFIPLGAPAVALIYAGYRLYKRRKR